MQGSSLIFDELTDTDFHIKIFKIRVIRRKLVTYHDHIMKPLKDVSLPLNVRIFRSTHRLTVFRDVLSYSSTVTNLSNDLPAYIFTHILRSEPAGCSETLVNSYHTTRQSQKFAQFTAS
jgi:hypothetical protein